jgi:hypothetical protein
MSTVCVQYEYSISTASVQHQYSISTASVQHQYSISTASVQHQYLLKEYANPPPCKALIWIGKGCEWVVSAEWVARC